MGELPRVVLSEHFQERMTGRRLRSAVFLTYQLDPGFFELEVLPVFLDAPLSHAAAIRQLQLEDALHGLAGEVAVYYDAGGLVAGDASSAKLDVRRIPVRHHAGVFHPKNVFLLVEAEQGGAQALIVASLSANLTRSGWWENLEACHVEELLAGEPSFLARDMVSFLTDLRRRARGGGEQRALREILALLEPLVPANRRPPRQGRRTHFFASPEPFVDFLHRAAGRLPRGMCLEVISPYLDDAPSSGPLQDLVDRFRPEEVRVFLPRSAAGEGLCRAELYEAVRALPGVRWGRLPKAPLRLGRGEGAGERFVHAKVYRFFSQHPRRELCFVGSANLTTAAHRGRGNVETGFLVDLVPDRRPDFWLEVDDDPPPGFEAGTDGEPAPEPTGTRLTLRYHWDRGVAEAFWDAPGLSPELMITARGLVVGRSPALPPRAWTKLGEETARRIAELLEETSLFEVHGEGEVPRLLLVQEEGMSHKPSLLLRLTVADILRYWALLAPEQRAAFVEARAPELALAGEGAELVVRLRARADIDTLFGRFAGIFHGFGCLERAVRAALESGRDKEADYRVFGRRYDSLISLLERATSPEAGCDEVEAYVILGCAHQLCHAIAGDYREYWSDRGADARRLTKLVEERRAAVRRSLIDGNPEGFEQFLDWFDPRFHRRAEPVGEDRP